MTLFEFDKTYLNLDQVVAFKRLNDGVTEAITPAGRFVIRHNINDVLKVVSKKSPLKMGNKE